MSVGTATRLMTLEEFEALPDDGMERELILGELKERPMTMRNQHHSFSMAEMTHALLAWVKSMPKPWGKVVNGEAGFVIRRDPLTSVGIDVAYLSPERSAKTSEDSTFFEGAPNVAVEILSPSDSHADVSAKIREYLKCGVELVLVLDPDFRTVMAHRPGRPPELFTVGQDLRAEDVLPGFRVPVVDLFA